MATVTAAATDSLEQLLGDEAETLLEFRRTEALIEFTRNKPISAILPSLEREHPSFASEPRQWW